MEPSTVVRLVRDVEDSVMCDGFHGYFFNSSEDPAAAIQALELIGAPVSADIVRRACGRFPGGMPPPDRFPRQDALEIAAPEADEFADLDLEFFAYPENLEALVQAYSEAPT
jgi:hypothetical protein